MYKQDRHTGIYNVSIFVGIKFMVFDEKPMLCSNGISGGIGGRLLLLGVQIWSTISGRIMENAALHSETLQILHMARKCMHRSTTANSSDTLGKGYRKGFLMKTLVYWVVYSLQKIAVQCSHNDNSPVISEYWSPFWNVRKLNVRELILHSKHFRIT